MPPRPRSENLRKLSLGAHGKRWRGASEPLLSVISEHLFEDSLTALTGSTERGDEFVAAAEDLLSREPLSGARMENGLWSLPMSPVGGADVWLIYTFDENAVHLLFVGRF